MTTRKIDFLSIYGRRWFQRTYGNSYHTVKLVLNFDNGDTEIIQSGVSDGYGNHYQTTAYEELEQRGYVEPRIRYPKSGDVERPLTALDRQGIRFFDIVSDVPRKKDLLA